MNQREFEQKFLVHWPAMYQMAGRMLDPEDAEDVVQDLFERFLGHLDELDGVSSPLAYCLAATRRLCIDRLRNRARHPAVPLDAVADPPSAATDQLESMQQQERIIGVIDTLPAGQRTVMRLRVLGQLDNDEIARHTGFSNETVRQQLSRGRRKLRDLLSDLLK